MGFASPGFLSAFLAVGAALISVAPACYAQEPLNETATFNLTEENDSIGSTSDKHYTQGLRLSLASGATTSGTRASIADGVLLVGKGAEHPSTYRYSVSMGQSIFTPTNVFPATPDPGDRPYAGWLYVGTAVYRETPKTLDRAEITFGLVGPGAGGGVVQNNWH